MSCGLAGSLNFTILESYIASDFKPLITSTPNQSKKTRGEKVALKSLKENLNVIIKNADKGGGVVI